MQINFNLRIDEKLNEELILIAENDTKRIRRALPQRTGDTQRHIVI